MVSFLTEVEFVNESATPSVLYVTYFIFVGSHRTHLVQSARKKNNTYLLTPWCRVLLEKLTGLQIVKKFPAFHGTRRFITALTSVRHLSLSRASPIQSIYPHPTSWRSILILSIHLRLGLPSGLLPSGFPTKTLYTPSPHLYAPHAQPISIIIIIIIIIIIVYLRQLSSSQNNTCRLWMSVISGANQNRHELRNSFAM